VTQEKLNDIKSYYQVIGHLSYKSKNYFIGSLYYLEIKS
jgi:hypothetical protein